MDDAFGFVIIRYALIRFAEISIARTRSCVQKISGFTLGEYGANHFTRFERGFLNNVLTVLISRLVHFTLVSGGRKRDGRFYFEIISHRACFIFKSSYNVNSSYGREYAHLIQRIS